MTQPMDKPTPIADLKPGLRSLTCQFIVLHKSGPTSTTREGNVVHHLLVADATAAINMSVWDDYGDLLHEGDIVRLTNGLANLHKNSLNLYVGKLGQLKRVGRYNMVFTETPNMSQFIVGPDGSMRPPAGTGQLPIFPHGLPPASIVTATPSPPSAVAGGLPSAPKRPSNIPSQQTHQPGRPIPVPGQRHAPHHR